MAKFKYQGINFAEDYNKSFAEFTKDFEGAPCFKSIPHKERPKTMKVVYNELIKHNEKLSKKTTEKAKNLEVESKEVKPKTSGKSGDSKNTESESSSGK